MTYDHDPGIIPDGLVRAAAGACVLTAEGAVYKGPEAGESLTREAERTAV